MKFSTPGRAILLALFVGAVSTTDSAGQMAADTNAASTPKPPPSLLDNDEMMQLHKVREEVLRENPDLQSEEERLRSAHEAAQGTSMTPEQKSAMQSEWQAYQAKMRAVMLKIDPTLAPIFAKLDKAHLRAASAQAAPFTPRPVRDGD
jgi:hypothetical protein